MSVIHPDGRPVSRSAADLGPPISVGSGAPRPAPAPPPAGYPDRDRFEPSASTPAPATAVALAEVPAWTSPETVQLELPPGERPELGAASTLLDGVVSGLSARGGQEGFDTSVYAAAAYSAGELNTIAAEIGFAHRQGRAGLRYAARSDGEQQVSLRVTVPLDALTRSRARRVDAAEDRVLAVMTDELTAIDESLQSELTEATTEAARASAVSSAWSRAVPIVTQAGIDLDNLDRGPLAPDDRARFAAAVTASGLPATLDRLGAGGPNLEGLVEGLFDRLAAAGDNAP